MTRFEAGGPGAWKSFEFFFQPWLRRKLNRIHIAGLPDPSSLADPTRPLVLVANHVSWFDGFLLREIQRRVRPAAVFKTVMLESELRANPILRALGGVGFDPDRPMGLRGVVRDLARLPHRASRRGAGEMAGSETAPRVAPVVAFFPQGRIYPSFREPLGFRPGVRLLVRGLAPCTVLGVGMHLEPGNSVAPQAFLHAAPLRPVDRGTDVPTPGELDEAVGRALSLIHRHLRIHGEAASEAWPPRPTETLEPAQ
ncbi:MAG: hypothetical protein EA422_10880 [Gemmatimonadales bacterium]|nr:MAG: hypothetical protein EA422_10880 [Gemmatimonadales bacterium]